MSKFASGEKASKEEAERKLRKHVVAVWDRRFDVRFESDDGGTHLCLYLEVDDVSKPLDKFVVDSIWEPKWLGWRFLLIKCPPGYIDAILNSTISDDY